MKEFIKLCTMSQIDLKSFAAKELEKTHSSIYVGDGYVYAPGCFPVLLVAHLDTVHTTLPKTVLYGEKTGTITSPEGIGGDDRCGIFMILEILKQFHCSVLFCEDEELGNVGAKKFMETNLAKPGDFNYIIELDRKNSNDAVFYNCANVEFERFITKEFFETAIGSEADISYLAPTLNCAAVNLSCGYYNLHTLDEYVVIPEMHKIIDATCNILARTKADDKFEYIAASAQ